MVLFHDSAIIRENTLTTSNGPAPNQILRSPHLLTFALLVLPLCTHPIDSSTRFIVLSHLSSRSVTRYMNTYAAHRNLLYSLSGYIICHRRLKVLRS